MFCCEIAGQKVLYGKARNFKDSIPGTRVVVKGEARGTGENLRP